MAVQKDVLIAGGVVVGCVALVIVALVATSGGKDKPAEPTTDVVSTSADSTFNNNYGTGSGTSGGGSTYTPPPVGDYPPVGPSPLDSTPPGPAPLPPITQTPTPGPIGVQPSPFSGDPVPPVTGPAPVAAPAPGGGTHTVAKGETLGDISSTHYGTTKHWPKIVEANPGINPARLKVGQVLQIPTIEATATSAGPVANGPDTYTVQKGDSYYIIAKKQLGAASRWRELERLNNIPAEDLKVGIVLKLPPKESGDVGTGATPTSGGKTHIVAKGETLGDISKQYFGTTTKWKSIVEANPGVRPENLKVGQSLAIPDLPASATTGPVVAPAGGSTYTVKAGDTLESIAAAQLGKKSAWKQIVDANPGLKPTSLRVGQTIVVPGGTAAPADAVPAPIGGAPAPGAVTPGLGTPPPAAPVAPPAPTFQDDLFYSPYDKAPATAPTSTPAPMSSTPFSTP